MRTQPESLSRMTELYIESEPHPEGSGLLSKDLKAKREVAKVIITVDLTSQATEKGSEEERAEAGLEDP